MPTISRFEDIEAWKTARELTSLVYELTNHDKFSRDFGLKDQIRRAAVSVMSNIAEGFENQTQAQFIRYLGIAKGSSAEVRSQLYVALDQSYISAGEFQKAYELSNKALRQIVRFIAYLVSNSQASQIRDEQAEYNVNETDAESR